MAAELQKEVIATCCDRLDDQQSTGNQRIKDLGHVPDLSGTREKLTILSVSILMREFLVRK